MFDEDMILKKFETTSSYLTMKIWACGEMMEILYLMGFPLTSQTMLDVNAKAGIYTIMWLKLNGVYDSLLDYFYKQRLSEEGKQVEWTVDTNEE